MPKQKKTQGTLLVLGLYAAISGCSKQDSTASRAPQAEENSNGSSASGVSGATSSGTSDHAPDLTPSPIAPSPSPAPAQQPSADKPQAFELKENYQSPHLTLAYPSTQNWGAITLVGQDAQTLFDALHIQVESVGGDTTWRPDRTKRGQRVECIEHTPGTDAAKSHVCTFVLDYRSGQILAVQSPGTSDDTSATAPKADYSGTNLTLDADSHLASALLTGEDARALYFTLNIKPQPIQAADGQASFIKSTGDIACTQAVRKDDPAQATYNCAFKFSYWSGGLK